MITWLHHTSDYFSFICAQFKVVALFLFAFFFVCVLCAPRLCHFQIEMLKENDGKPSATSTSPLYISVYFNYVYTFVRVHFLFVVSKRAICRIRFKTACKKKKKTITQKCIKLNDHTLSLPKPFTNSCTYEENNLMNAIYTYHTLIQNQQYRQRIVPGCMAFSRTRRNVTYSGIVGMVRPAGINVHQVQLTIVQRAFVCGLTKYLNAEMKVI